MNTNALYILVGSGRGESESTNNSDTTHSSDPIPQTTTVKTAIADSMLVIGLLSGAVSLLVLVLLVVTINMFR